VSKVWETYKHIKCSDFIAWWNKLSTKHKVEWQEEKDKIDKIIEDEFWDRESRRVIRDKK
jgi:flagellar biosynthesis chaperone FliJ